MVGITNSNQPATAAPVRKSIPRAIPKKHGRIIDADEFMYRMMTTIQNSTDNPGEDLDVAVNLIKSYLDLFSTTLIEPTKDNPYDLSEFYV